MRGGDIPLLDLVEALEGGDGDKDDNCLLAVADFNLSIEKSACELHDLTKIWSAARPSPQQLGTPVTHSVPLFSCISKYMGRKKPV